MQGQQISLKWKSFQANVLSSFESMWEEEGLVDVTLATDGKCLKAHKIMLSASSPFFKKIFQMNPCQHPVVVLQDVHYTELESILKFVYKGEVCISQNELPLLLKAAETLQIRGLCRRLSKESESDEEFTSNCEKLDEDPPVSNTPPQSPKSAKRLKTCHIFNSNEIQSNMSPKTNLYPSPVSVYPVAVDEIKHESPIDSSTSSKEKYASSPKPTPIPDERLSDLENDDNDLTANAHEYSNDLDQASENFSFPPFPCPFCDRAYTRWGFRRRHIKACHTQSQSLPCKWCLEVLPSHSDWESHVCSQHSLSKSDARNGLMILEEAEVVLQIPQPSRLDALVTMIKEQTNKTIEQRKEEDDDEDDDDCLEQEGEEEDKQVEESNEIDIVKDENLKDSDFDGNSKRVGF